MIRVQNIRKSFREIPALRDISFSIGKGEIVGLLGPNGAGKTTTMRVMTGYLAPDAGQVFITDIDVAKSPLKAQSVIGYMPENNPLYYDMLVCEMLQFSANLRKLTKEKKLEGIDFAVKSADLAQVYYRPIRELSKGFKQRVGLACAILHRPPVLILDEPTEGLDPNQRIEIRSVIKQLSKNHTVLLSTHVMQEVEAICNRVLVLNRGQVVADANPVELSHGAGGSHTVVIEGTNVVENLKKCEQIESLETIQKDTNRVELVLRPKKGFEIPPLLSQLSKKHGWVLWKLTPEQVNLEEIFQQLTK